MGIKMKTQWKQLMIKSLKIAAAALLAIALAGELGLKYSATAGIITVLSIQNTKRETLKSAGNRALAFLCALLLCAAWFHALGYTLWAFSGYLFCFALLCLFAGWGEAIAMDSVLITHFLTEGSMGREQLQNELLLFLIGTGIGILVNLHLHKKEREFRALSDEADRRIRQILYRMSRWLPQEDKTAYDDSCFGGLEEALKAARICAAANYNNALFQKSTYELDYVEMRERQSVILKELYRNIKRIEYLPEQAEQIAGLLGEIERDYHRENTVTELLQRLEALLRQMKEQQLPQTREEFEARAILFYILMQLKNLLALKHEFMLRQAESTPPRHVR